MTLINKFITLAFASSLISAPPRAPPLCWQNAKFSKILERKICFHGPRFLHFSFLAKQLTETANFQRAEKNSKAARGCYKAEHPYNLFEKAEERRALFPFFLFFPLFDYWMSVFEKKSYCLQRLLWYLKYTLEDLAEEKVHFFAILSYLNQFLVVPSFKIFFLFNITIIRH